MASIDRADWHSGGNFPADLPPENGGTHIGMYLAWVIHNGLEGDDHRDEAADDLATVRRREKTGRDFLFEQCDGKFLPADLSPDGMAFTAAYYQGSGGEPYGEYMTDYMVALVPPGLPSIYHVADTWENFDKLATIVNRRYADWRQARGNK